MHSDTVGLYDIYGLHHVPFWNEVWFAQSIMLFFCISVFIFSCIISMVFYKKARKIVTIDPWAQSLSAIESMRVRNYSACGNDCKQFYDRLTHIVKNYLCIRYGVARSGATDHEFVECVDACSDPISMVSPVLKRGIAVKFASSTVEPDQQEKDYQLVYTFIKSTKPLLPRL